MSENVTTNAANKTATPQAGDPIKDAPQSGQSQCAGDAGRDPATAGEMNRVREEEMRRAKERADRRREEEELLKERSRRREGEKKEPPLKLADGGPDIDRVQYVHDLFMTVTSGETPVTLRAFDRLSAAALSMAADVVCWALGHNGTGETDRINQTVTQLELMLHAAGYRVSPNARGQRGQMGEESGRGPTPAGDKSESAESFAAAQRRLHQSKLDLLRAIERLMPGYTSSLIMSGQDPFAEDGSVPADPVSAIMGMLFGRKRGG